MDNENKKYSIIGKVEIGTDEYRDLIERCVEANAELSRVRCDNWDKTSKIDSLNKRIAELENAADLFKKFINSDDELNAKYISFIAEESIFG